MGLTNDQISSLLNRELARSKPPQEKRELRFVKPQVGPLRRYEQEMRCASKGCGSSTYFRLEGIPRCMMHSLLLMNEMLVSLGVEE